MLTVCNSSLSEYAWTYAMNIAILELNDRDIWMVTIITMHIMDTLVYLQIDLILRLMCRHYSDLLPACMGAIKFLIQKRKGIKCTCAIIHCITTRKGCYIKINGNNNIMWLVESNTKPPGTDGEGGVKWVSIASHLHYFDPYHTIINCY